ncbi:hypothetical protein [Ulvibacter antarcticus]|uniref:Uncharacterized protein n=1 Tax=Ulvibacter antarcticus TaxID=442714 RepID=A0A3L9YYB3_9FLAO|nr:hypothetical protein [Ulvibacter antarcticus]RMA65721.1 hypothetical protein BXY75_0133 [Ulvibacter antarcticus]
MRTTEGLREVPHANLEVTNSYFSVIDTDYVYKAKIEIYGRNLGGILVIKKMGPETHRVVFTTEFGSKIFDFLFEGDTFTKNFVLEDLDRKLIITTLEKDFRVLIKENVAVVQKFTSENLEVYKSVSDKSFNFYFSNTSEGRLTKITNTSKRKEKFEILFNSIVPDSASEENKIADSIDIIHKNIKLAIHLDYLKNN